MFVFGGGAEGNLGVNDKSSDIRPPALLCQNRGRAPVVGISPRCLAGRPWFYYSTSVLLTRYSLESRRVL